MMKLQPLSFLALLVLFAAFPLAGHALPEDAPDLPDAPAPQSAPVNSTPAQAATATPQGGQQTKRILYIVPNFRAVSSDEKLPPQSVKEKFKTAALDSVDYSSFIFVGAQAGVNQWRKGTPEFRQGAAGYGRYFWHTYADTFDENLWVEFLLPVAFRQDSRFYTLNRGSLGKKAVYSASRIFITRTDSGRETFNASEVLGAGAASGISNLYYPREERTFTKVYQRWLTSLSIDGVTFMVKEFWPVINDKFFHQTD
jgi:hypothetical protein